MLAKKSGVAIGGEIILPHPFTYPRAPFVVYLVIVPEAAGDEPQHVADAPDGRQGHLFVVPQLEGGELERVRVLAHRVQHEQAVRPHPRRRVLQRAPVTRHLRRVVGVVMGFVKI